LTALVIVWWWRFDLLLPTSLPAPGRLVEAYALILSTMSVAIVSLFVMGATAIASRGRSAA